MSDGELFFAAEENDDGSTSFVINPDRLRTPYDAGVTVYYLQKQLSQALEHFGKADSYAAAMSELVRGATEEMQRDLEGS